jgi:inosine-uridine nucleoside N-ribohydrolase
MLIVKNILITLAATLICTHSIAKPVIIDTDLGVDDWQAITYLLAQPDVQIKAITIAADGENNCKQGYPQLLTLLELTKRQNIPVACGPSKPLKGSHVFPSAWRSQSNGFFGIPIPEEIKKKPLVENAPALLINTLKQSKQPIPILALGPMTNLALAIRQNKEIWQQKVSAVHATASNFGQDNFSIQKYFPKSPITKNSWNIYIDPLASSIVLSTTKHLVLTTRYALNKLNSKPLYNSLIKLKDRNIHQDFVLAVLSHTRSDPFVGDQLTALLWHKKNICKLKLKPVYYTVGNQKLKRLAPQCLNVSMDDFIKAYLGGIN